jgi:hypothetical protein
LALLLMSPGFASGSDVCRSFIELFLFRTVVARYALGGNRPLQGMMDAAILPVSRCGTNASVRVDI